MVQATKELQYDRRTDNYAIGRPTRGAALAVRAYALILQLVRLLMEIMMNMRSNW